VNQPAIYSFLTAVVALICGTVLELNGQDATPLWLVAAGGGGAGAMAASSPLKRP
jgi:hypothetical protein